MGRAFNWVWDDVQCPGLGSASTKKKKKNLNCTFKNPWCPNIRLKWKRICSWNKYAKVRTKITSSKLIFVYILRS